MKNKFIQYFSALTIVTILLSCESLIDVDFPSDQLNSEEVYQDKSTIEASLSAIYNTVRTKSLFTNTTSGASPLLSLYTDDLQALSTTHELYNNIHSPDSSLIYNGFWSNTYTLIYAINSFLENLEKSTILDPIEKKTYLAEARFLRALQYHYLTQLFGDIPLITTTDYKTNTTIPKTNINDVLAFVEEELKISLEALQNNYRNPLRIYPNKSTAELVLAKNYLLQKNYALAELHAKNVVENPHYQIENDINKVFKINAKSTIWQFSLKPVASSDLIVAPEALLYILTSIPTSTIMLTEDLINSFESNDKRKLSWIGSVTDNTTTFYFNYKYKNRISNTDEYSIVFRIEEAYFTLIEALAYQDKIPEATVVLNKVRLRAGIPSLSSTLTQNTFINEMLQESRKEFFTETMHRFLDLKRNNKLSILKSTKPNWKDYHQLLPIPENEILINPNLLPQNHDY